MALTLSCASQLSRSVTNEMKRLTCCCSGSGDQQLRDPEPAFEVVGVLQAGERHEAGHRPEQRLVVAAGRDRGVKVQQRRDDRAVGGLDRRRGRRGGTDVDLLAVCLEFSQLPKRPVEGLAHPGVVGVGVQPADELLERRGRPVDHDPLRQHPVAGDRLARPGRDPVAAQRPLGLELVDERVASDRELGQIVAAAGLGASGERGSDPDSGEGDQAHEGEGEDGDHLRTNWRMSQHGLVPRASESGPVRATWHGVAGLSL